MSPATTRWCPTPEQLMMLEEMYRGGIRTPSATQIQQITAHLSNYGRIEGKNVFYWFQNHKARDRQRLRRKHQQFHNNKQHHHHHHHLRRYFASPPAMTVTATPFPQLQHVTCYNHAPTFLLPPPPQIDLTGKGVRVVHAEDDGDKKKEMEMETIRHKQKHADWNMTMVQVPYYTTMATNNRPLKTLELFPLTATNLAEECK